MVERLPSHRQALAARKCAGGAPRTLEPSEELGREMGIVTLLDYESSLFGSKLPIREMG
jgi:hypothetical protein